MHNGGGGGGGHSGGHSGGGHHQGSGHHQGGGGHSHNPALAAHNLGGKAQAAFGHVANMVQNNQGVLGHIASWLSGQHIGGHHPGGHQGQQNQVGDATWATSALQVEKKDTWQKRVVKMPAFHILAAFIVIAGWLFFLGMLRHGENAQKTAASGQQWSQPMSQQNTQENAAPEQQVVAQQQAGFSMFGMPRDVDGAVLPQANGLPPSAYAMTQPGYGQVAVQPQPQVPAAPAPQLGRRAFSARVALGQQQAADPMGAMGGMADMNQPIESRRGFAHRTVTNR